MTSPICRGKSSSGGSTGIGYETAKALLTQNARVYIGCRSPEKAKKAIDHLRAECGGKEAIFLPLDLASLKELHVLFNNAAVMEPPVDQLTKDGYDLTIGLLLPALKEGAQTSSDGKARVVNTSSFVYELSSNLDYDLFRDGPARKKLVSSTENMYYQSKFDNVVYSIELARRYGEEGIVSTSMNPLGLLGHIQTDVQNSLTGVRSFLIDRLSYPASQGALTQLYTGTTAEGANLNGKHLAPWARVYSPSPASQDPKVGKTLWSWLEEQI
ncbi:NAD-binding protein [Desarmillaria ectypa]|nr:NAD-binding protein [Desarmillaria ectypa]